MHEQLRQQYLQAMGIQLWESRIQPLNVGEDRLAVVKEETVACIIDTTPFVAADPEVAGSVSGLPDWQTLQQAVEACQSCGLYENRIYPVFGAGSKSATVMFVGEAPGEEEDRQGEPFVGRAGQLLNEMLHSIGFNREQVYIANIIKCRPPNNRDPRSEEIVACDNFLRQQIQLLQPKLIVALGRIAAHHLLKTDVSLASLRGQFHACSGIKVPVMVTYHPAYLLRKPLKKRHAWADLQMIHGKLLAEEGA